MYLLNGNIIMIIVLENHFKLEISLPKVVGLV